MSREQYDILAADGSMRDALSLLDQCIAFYLGQKLTYDNVLEVLGAVDTDVFSRLLRNIIARDVPKVLDTVEELVMQGRELSQLTADFTWYLRNLLLVKTSDNMEDVLDVSSENLQQLKEEAQMIEVGTLLRYIRIFSELSGQMKYATQKRVLLEVALIKLCTPAMEVNTDSLLDRIRAVEDRLDHELEAVQEKVVYVNASEVNGIAGNTNSSRKSQPKPELPDAVPEEIQKVVQNFRSIADEVSAPTSIYLKQARLSLGGDNRLLIVLSDSIAAESVKREDHKQEIESVIEQRIGKKVEVEVRQLDDGRRFEDTFVDLEKHMEKVINMEITVED